MPRVRAIHVFITLGFLATIGSAGLIQSAAELRDGERPGALEVFDRPPTAANLHSFERSLEESSSVASTLRPWMQFAQYELLSDAGEKALVGRQGWLFYRPGLNFVTQRPASPPPRHAGADPFLAIKSFHDQLKARDIRLLMLPVPNKESIYPEMLSRRADGAGVIMSSHTRALLDELRAARIEFVDLFEVFRRAKQQYRDAGGSRLYLAQDSHWSPEGMNIAAGAVAERIIQSRWLEMGTVAYEGRPARTDRLGDLIQMLQVPQLNRVIAPETVDCVQIVQQDTGQLYKDAPESRLLVLGDSFLRIYDRDEPGAAGFVAHLAHDLRQPSSSIINDGGASTLVRQDLARRPRSLANKRLVLWEFVERDIVAGTEGWQIIPLPPRDS